MIHPVTGSFVDAGLEAAWRRHFATEYAGYLQAGALFLPVLFGLFGAVDPLLEGADVAQMWALRFGLVTPALFLLAPIFFLRSLSGFRERWVQELMLVEAVIALSGLDALGAIGARGAGVPMIQAGTMGLLLALAFLYCFSRLRMIYAAPVGLLGSIASLVVLANHPARTPALVASCVFYGLVMNGIGIWVCRSMERLAREAFARGEQVRAARARSDALLRNALPESIAARLRGAERSSFAERHAEVTVIVADVVGFTALSERLELTELGQLLDRVFSSFDELCTAHGVEKIKTLGDGWLACAGAPSMRPDHAEAVADLALAMLAVAAREAPVAGGQLALRIGVASGSVVAGVIGHTRFAYDLWGEAVTDAVRMEQGGAPGRVRVSPATAARLTDRVEWGTDSAGARAAWLLAEAR